VCLVDGQGDAADEHVTGQGDAGEATDERVTTARDVCAELPSGRATSALDFVEPPDAVDANLGLDDEVRDEDDGSDEVMEDDNAAAAAAAVAGSQSTQSEAAGNNSPSGSARFVLLFVFNYF